MNDRRTFLATGTAALALAASGARAQSCQVTVEDIRKLFQSRPLSVRQMAQQGLASNGLYRGNIDGVWGPGTANAFARLLASERYLRHARKWDWDHRVQVMDTMLFFSSDAYM